MRVIIAGSREICDYNIVDQAVLRSKMAITEIVSGGCRGVDKCAEVWANKNGVKVKIFVADWDKNGRAAGPIRNARMAIYADALIAIWDGRSKGTKNMMDAAKKKGMRVYLQYVIRDEKGLYVPGDGFYL